jgi:hypothetical protein
MERNRVAIVAAAGLLGLAGCLASRPVDSAAGAPPEIIAITPSSGPAGTAYPIEVTLLGRGFGAAANVVTFGPVQLPDLASPDGQHITFLVPKEKPSRGEVPPLVLPRGQYPITVTTAAGTSPAVLFTLTSRP